MAIFFDRFDTMVFLNKCLRCGEEYHMDYMEGATDGWEENPSPTDPDKWDA